MNDVFSNDLSNLCEIKISFSNSSTVFLIMQAGYYNSLLNKVIRESLAFGSLVETGWILVKGMIAVWHSDSLF